MKPVESTDKIRVSTGSAMVLGLLQGKLDAEPTTIYLLTYQEDKCTANCGFCPQARTSRGRADMLSRVAWPPFPTQQVLSRIERMAGTGKIKRVCIQSLNYPTVFQDIVNIVKAIKSLVEIPVSISCQPLNRDKMKIMAEAGVNRISIALDAATEQLFDTIKGRQVSGPYIWKKQREGLLDAVKVFGNESVSTHLIVGLGETDEEIVQMIQWCEDSGVYPSLFAFTPIPGTLLEKQSPPQLSRYRRIQIAQYLITHRKTRYERMAFNGARNLIDFGIPEEQLETIIKTGNPFLTSGCPGCNRPYYNERPGGPMYNYPRQPLPDEIAKIEKQLEFLGPKRLRPSRQKNKRSNCSKNGCCSENIH